MDGSVNPTLPHLRAIIRIENIGVAVLANMRELDDAAVRLTAVKLPPRDARNRKIRQRLVCRQRNLIRPAIPRRLNSRGFGFNASRGLISDQIIWQIFDRQGQQLLVFCEDRIKPVKLEVVPILVVSGQVRLMEKMRPSFKGQHMAQCHIGLHGKNLGVVPARANCARCFTWILPRLNKTFVITIVVLVF